MKRWECTDLGEPKEFLGMQITHDKKARKIFVDQKPYLEKVVKHFGMLNCKHADTPLPLGFKLTINTSTIDPEL